MEQGWANPPSLNSYVACLCFSKSCKTPCGRRTPKSEDDAWWCVKVAAKTAPPEMQELSYNQQTSDVWPIPSISFPHFRSESPSLQQIPISSKDLVTSLCQSNCSWSRFFSLVAADPAMPARRKDVCHPKNLGAKTWVNSIIFNMTINGSSLLDGWTNWYHL